MEERTVIAQLGKQVVPERERLPPLLKKHVQINKST
jgi:hypothetical protein